jgi:hypothetical protein
LFVFLCGCILYIYIVYFFLCDYIIYCVLYVVCVLVWLYIIYLYCIFFLAWLYYILYIAYCMYSCVAVYYILFVFFCDTLLMVPGATVTCRWTVLYDNILYRCAFFWFFSLSVKYPEKLFQLKMSTHISVLSAFPYSTRLSGLTGCTSISTVWIYQIRHSLFF